MADRPATSSVQHATAAYGHLLDLLERITPGQHDRAVESVLGFGHAVKELSGYQWEALDDHLRDRYCRPDHAVERQPMGHGPAPRPVADAPQA